MVKFYRRTSEPVSGDTIRAAIHYYWNLHPPNQRETCRNFGLTRSVFQKYLKWQLQDIPDECSQGDKPVFTEEMENEILSYVQALANRFYAMTRQALAELAFHLAERNHLPHPFQNGIAGNGWITGFLNRHEDKLSLRDGTPTSLVRITSFNRTEVYKFFNLLEEIVIAKGFTGSTIYNMDETGVTVVPSKSLKRIARKVVRSVPIMVPVERGRLVTVMCCFSAQGNYIPPMFVFPQTCTNISMAEASANSSYTTSSKGWSNTQCFIKWLKHFRKFAAPTPTTPLLLIVDNHGSHISYQAVIFCRRNSIELLTLPPHCTHKMQPADVSFFSPLKANYSKYLNKWLSEHPFQKPRMCDIPAIFSYAFNDAAKQETAVNGFRKTGIWVQNPATQQWGPNKHNFDDAFDEESDDDENSPPPSPPSSPPDSIPSSPPDSPPQSRPHSPSQSPPHYPSIFQGHSSLYSPSQALQHSPHFISQAHSQSKSNLPFLSTSHPTSNFPSHSDTFSTSQSSLHFQLPSDSQSTQFRSHTNLHDLNTYPYSSQPSSDLQPYLPLCSPSHFSTNLPPNTQHTHQNIHLKSHYSTITTHASPPRTLSNILPTLPQTPPTYFQSSASSSFNFHSISPPCLDIPIPTSSQCISQDLCWLLRNPPVIEDGSAPDSCPRYQHIAPVPPVRSSTDQPIGTTSVPPVGPPMDQPIGKTSVPPVRPPMYQLIGIASAPPLGPPTDQLIGIAAVPPVGPPTDQPIVLAPVPPVGPPTDQPIGIAPVPPVGPPISLDKKTKVRKNLKRQSLVPMYSDSSEESDYADEMIHRDPDCDDCYEILTGTKEAMGPDDVQTIVLPKQKPLIQFHKAFDVGPELITIERLFPTSQEAGYSGSKRKPRKKLSSELMTSNENLKILSQKEAKKKSKTSSSDSEKRQTRSATFSEKKSLRSGKNV